MSFSGMRKSIHPMMFQKWEAAEPQAAPVPPSHRLDEFPAGYSSAGCSPAEPASAFPATQQLVATSFRCKLIFSERRSVGYSLVSPKGCTPLVAGAFDLLFSTA
jgi:hypothetical protein